VTKLQAFARSYSRTALSALCFATWAPSHAANGELSKAVTATSDGRAGCTERGRGWVGLFLGSRSHGRARPAGRGGTACRERTTHVEWPVWTNGCLHGDELWSPRRLPAWPPSSRRHTTVGRRFGSSCARPPTAGMAERSSPTRCTSGPLRAMLLVLTTVQPATPGGDLTADATVRPRAGAVDAEAPTNVLGGGTALRHEEEAPTAKS
jgi:hypothetical protein